MSENKFDFGLVGLGVMGRNLLLNMADHGYSAIAFNRSEEKIAALKAAATEGTVVDGVTDLGEMIARLKRPRKIMLLVPAGAPVDEVIEKVLPHLESDDIIIDGGNSHYTDTLRRVKYVESKGFNFIGIGVSGGEQGARTGPSLMPGGSEKAYASLKPILEAVAAKVNGEPCVDYLGKGGAGHYVKMVHNGIEYGIMQLISESYTLLKAVGLNNDDLHEVFKTWNDGDLHSFLIEISRDIFLQKDDKSDNRLLDVISDKAGSKGTGKWTSQEAMNLPVAIPTIDAAVAGRTISGYKEERVKASDIYPRDGFKLDLPREEAIQLIHDALYFGTIISYAQGLSMLYQASRELEMDIPLTRVVSVWRGGCIIRSSLLEVFTDAYNSSPDLPNILLSKQIAALVEKSIENTRKIVAKAIEAGIPVAAHTASIGYFDAYRTAYLPTNLIQAQRDYFGAHTYQRIDIPGTFHTEWNS